MLPLLWLRFVRQCRRYFHFDIQFWLRMQPLLRLSRYAAGSEVLWVCGAGFAEGLAPDEDTAQVLQMEMEHREEIT